MKRSCLFILLLAPTPVLAQDGLSLGGSTRVRYEVIDGQPRAGFNVSDDLLSIRTILTGEYRTGPFKLGAELYDSRAYGGDAGTPITTGEVNALELVQAYVGYEVPGAFGADTQLGLQAGRFALNLGSRRLVAADDYRNTTNGYTGLRADIALGHGIAATKIYTLPQVRLPDQRENLVRNRVEFDRESFDLVLWGGVAAKKLGGGRGAIKLSFFHLGERDSPRLATRDRSLDTASLRFVREPGPGRFDFDGEVIYQWGSISTSLAASAPKLDVSAGFVHLEAGYTFRHPWSPHVSLEFDYASGDGRGDKFTRFDTLFGMRRADLAPAGIYNAVGRANVLAPGVRVEVTPSKRLDAFAAYRPLWLASRFDSFSTTGVRDAAGSAGRFSGHQAEARIRYWLIPKRLRLEWNGVLLAEGRFLRDAPNAPTGGDTFYNAFNATINR